jgi:hypothetical protein
MGLRLVVHDATGHGGSWLQPGLTASWQVGARLYQHYPPAWRADAVFGATTWQDALAWLCSVHPGAPIDEVQYWGHGLPGRIFIGTDVLTTRTLEAAHPLRDDVDAFVARLSGPQALVWFRTCGAFGGEAGQAFANACAARFGCVTAGHTHIIGPLQSGLHTVSPTSPANWPVSEGQTAGGGLKQSSPLSPHTITCLQGSIPAGW